MARAVLPATFDGVYFCPDRPDLATDRRKPAPGMVFEAQRDHDIDLARSFFIGDKAIDIECGRNAGVRTILVKTGYGAKETHAAPDWIAEDFAAAAEIILDDKALTIRVAHASGVLATVFHRRELSERCDDRRVQQCPCVKQSSSRWNTATSTRNACATRMQ